MAGSLEAEQRAQDILYNIIWDWNLVTVGILSVVEGYGTAVLVDGRDGAGSGRGKIGYGESNAIALNLSNS